MMTNTQDEIDKILEDLVYNGSDFTISKLILEARIDELDIVLPKTLDYDITPTQANKVSMRIESLESELKAKLGDK